MSIFDDIGDAVGDVGDSIGDAVGDVWDGITGIGEDLLGGVEDVAGWLPGGNLALIGIGELDDALNISDALFPEAPELEATESERALAEVSVRQHNDFIQRFRPLEDSFLQKIRNTEGRNNQARGIARADVAQAFDQQRKGLGAMTSPRDVFRMQRGLLAEGQQSGRAVSRAQQLGDQSERRGIQRFVAAGRGLVDQNRLGLTQAAASEADAAAAAAQREFGRDQFLATGLGQAAGTFAAFQPTFRNSNGGGTSSIWT